MQSFTAANAIQFPDWRQPAAMTACRSTTQDTFQYRLALCDRKHQRHRETPGPLDRLPFTPARRAVSGRDTISVAEGELEQSTAPAALSNLGGVSVTGAAFTGPVKCGEHLDGQESYKHRSPLRVTQYGQQETEQRTIQPRFERFNACYQRRKYSLWRGS